MIRPQGSLQDKVDCVELETFLEHSIKMTNIILVSSSWHLHLSLSLLHTCALCVVEVFIPMRYESTRKRWGSIPLFFYSLTIVCLYVYLFLSLHVVEIFVLLKHEGVRRRWSSTPILFVLQPLPIFPPYLLVSIDLCPTLCPLFVLPLQHHWGQKSFPFFH